MHHRYFGLVFITYTFFTFYWICFKTLVQSLYLKQEVLIPPHSNVCRAKGNTSIMNLFFEDTVLLTGANPFISLWSPLGSILPVFPIMFPSHIFSHNTFFLSASLKQQSWIFLSLLSALSLYLLCCPQWPSLLLYVLCFICHSTCSYPSLYLRLSI